MFNRGKELRTRLKAPRGVSLTKIRHRYVKLYAALVPFVGDTVDQAVIADIVDSLSDVMPTVQPDVIRMSCIYLLNQLFTRRRAAELAWRLSANYAQLARGTAVSPWIGQTVDELVIVQIVDIKKAPQPADAPVVRYDITLRVLTGTAAAALLTVRVPQDSLRKMCGIVGFSKKLPPSIDITSDLERMLLMCELTPTHNASYMISNLACTGTIRDYNTNLIEARYKRRYNCLMHRGKKCEMCKSPRCPASGVLFVDDKE